MARLAVLLLAASACSKPASDETCTCVPGNTVQTSHALVPGEPPRSASLGSAEARSDAKRRAGKIDGPAIVAALRRHNAMKAASRNPRDIKILDDEIRFTVIDLCSPCGSWVSDRMTMEELFPLDRIDDAQSVVCMGLVLRDGTTVYGSTRPPACR